MALTASIKDKIQKVEHLTAQAQAVLNEYRSTGGMPEEQKLRVSVMIGEGQKLKAEIADEQKMEEAKSDLADLDKFIKEPVNRIPHGVNGDHEERKTLERAGWSFRNGMAYKMTSLGKEVEMFSEKVFFGDIPTDDPAQALLFKTTRAAMGADYQAAYEHLVRATARYGAAALSMLSGAEQKALSEGTDTAGGFLVTPDVRAEMLARQNQTAIMRTLCTVQNTNRDVLKFPAVKANAGTYSGISGASIYSSGFVGGWAGETPAFSDTDPAFQTLEISVKKVRVATKLSNDFINDSAVSILAWLAQNGAEAMSLTEDQGFLTGDGTALQPVGLLNCGLTTVDVEGSTSNTISNTSSSPGSAPKLQDLSYNLPAQYAGNATILMRRTIEGKVRKLVDGQNRFMWQDLLGNGFGPSQRMLLDYPVKHSDWMPDDGTDTNKVILLGDFSKYIIAQRTEVTSLILRERFLDADQVGIILFARVGGGLHNTDAFRVGVV